jgi:hypothetical protein
MDSPSMTPLADNWAFSTAGLIRIPQDTPASSRSRRRDRLRSISQSYRNCSNGIQLAARLPKPRLSANRRPARALRGRTQDILQGNSRASEATCCCTRKSTEAVQRQTHINCSPLTQGGMAWRWLVGLHDVRWPRRSKYRRVRALVGARPRPWRAFALPLAPPTCVSNCANPPHMSDSSCHARVD